MPTPETLMVFTAAALLMNISAGPSNFYSGSILVALGLYVAQSERAG